MKRFPLAVVCLALAFLAGCDSTGSNGGSPASGPGVDPALIGTWRGIPGTSSALDTARITADSVVSTWTIPGGGSTVHLYSIYPGKYGTTFYAVAGTNGKAGRMGTTTGQGARDNVTFEYIFSHDTLLLEAQNSATYDTIVDRSSTNTHAVVRVE